MDTASLSYVADNLNLYCYRTVFDSLQELVKGQFLMPKTGDFTYSMPLGEVIIKLCGINPNMFVYIISIIYIRIIYYINMDHYTERQLTFVKGSKSEKKKSYYLYWWII